MSELPNQPRPDTRRLLLEGALACLSERGAAGTTSRAIAAASGVNLAGITYHFGSKDDLVAQAMLEAIRRWLDPALTILRSDGDPVSRMIGAVQALQSAFEQARPTLPVVIEALAQSPRNDAVRRETSALFGELTGFLSTQMSELKAMGFLPGWIDPPAMAVLLVAMGEGLAVHAVVDPKAVDQEAVAGQLIQLLLSARATPEATR
jgi:AcrR family transcriptional regulator